MSWLKEHYGIVEGPLGEPCTEKQAHQLDDLIKSIPKDDLHEPGRITIKEAISETGERSDVSWISTEAVDRDKEIVISKGMNDEHFRMNPVVPIMHSKWSPPAGRSLWRKVVKDGKRVGIKAKTVYPDKPKDYEGDWIPDDAFRLVQSGLLNGKSIGFIPTKSRRPTDDEIRRNPDLATVWRIIEEWILIEYSLVYIPAQQEAIVEEIGQADKNYSKIIEKCLNIDVKNNSKKVGPTIPFVRLETIEDHIKRQFDHIDFEKISQEIIMSGLNKHTGKV